MEIGLHNVSYETPCGLAECQSIELSQESLGFWTRVAVAGQLDCWLWLGGLDGKGYGQAVLNGKRVLAHRLAWASVKGAIPAGLGVLHRCDVPRCVNPSHLFLGTQLDNMRDAAAKGRLAKEQPSNRRVSSEVVAAMLSALEAGERPASIARRFGVYRSFITNLRSGYRRKADVERFNVTKKGRAA